MLSVITLTTAVSGSGKTYARCPVFLLKEFLPNKQGVHYSNFPVFVDLVAAEAARLHGKPEEEYVERVKVIPPAVIETWRLGKSGPWDFFADVNLQDAHIAIDEVHNFCGRKTDKKIIAKWQAWLGEIRHRGATVELISQHFRKIAQALIDEAGTRLQLVTTETRRDPIFGIAMGDWYELKAKFLTGTYDAKCWEIEKREVDGRWVNGRQRLFRLNPHYFKFYDSYSQPHSGGVKGSGTAREFQSRGYIGLLWWFTRRNFMSVAVRLLIAGGIFGLMSGHTQPLFTWFLDGIVKAGMSAQGGTAVAQSAPPVTRPLASGNPTPPPPALTPNGPVVEPTTRRRVAVFHSTPATKPADPEGDWIVVGLMGDRIIFANGVTLRAGERASDGIYKGFLLLKVDYAEGVAEFQGGKHVSVGR